ncbi:MAG TPA: GYD domain-containing protein [Xanthobacteraceae bacterium]|nr:GYD domain-containing protein [Xanthobacteraceae bacterium]
MPLFITYASYSQTGVKGLVDKPADRSSAIKAVVEKAGGKVVAVYMTTGPNDVVLVTDVPDGTDAVAVGWRLRPAGRWRNLKPCGRGRRPNSKPSRKRQASFPVRTRRPEDDLSLELEYRGLDASRSAGGLRASGANPPYALLFAVRHKRGKEKDATTKQGQRGR